MKEKKVLIIEDDEEISDLLEIHLTDQNFDVTRAFDGEIGLNTFKKGGFDLVILDIMLPKINGLDICKEMRNSGDYTPILMLTSKTDEIDKVVGLELGADDYVTKPFGIRELIARVKALLRRVDGLKKNEGKAEEEELEYGSLTIDRQKRKASLNGERLDLTRKEYELLELLGANPGKTFTREQILTEIWGYHYSGYEHTVNSHINRLRTKIEPDPNNPTYILTTWGVGYRFSENINEK